MAGVQTMPFTAAGPLGSIFASVLAKKGPVMYVVVLAGVFQTLGFALLATAPVSMDIPARIYGYQILAGFGCGINNAALLLIVPFVVEYRDKGTLIDLIINPSSNQILAQRPLSAPSLRSASWAA